MLLTLFGLALASAPDWHLVGVYDATAAASLDGQEAGFAWRAHPAMSATCGPAKSPDGLGIFEAEAVGGRLSPVLAVVLEGSGSLRADQVRISLGRAGPEVLLQPMVEPRNLAIRVSGTHGTERIAQLVRTQLETEACMEHKTGRAWTGHDAARVRQAFLLDPPTGMDRSRKFFGGQNDPVPALLGPPDACLTLEGDGLPRGEASGRGEGSLTLVPTDVWGASLRRCSTTEMPGQLLADPVPRLSLRSGDDQGPPQETPPRWERLEVDLSLEEGPGTEEQRARVTLAHGPEVLLRDEPLFIPTDSTPGMIDLLAAVPTRLPAVGPPEAPSRYTVLLVPDWQVVEALRRLEADAPDTPRAAAPSALNDGTATLLARPELLFVQVADDPAEDRWANLAGVMSSRLGPPWGYTVGALHGRAHIVLPGTVAPTWEQTLRAQRGDVHAALLAGCLAVVLALGFGLRRVQDLLNPRAEERAHYWPGLAPVNVHDNETNNPLEGEEEL